MLKRLFDIAVSACLLVVLALPLAILCLVVRSQLGSPVFFRQKRPGRNGKVFELIKFRTMTNERDADGNLLPDADRLRPIGLFLRATSLDELPELWNVLKGEMSLVGPRPLLVQYLPLYNVRQARRHEVRPGVTGLAQVKGRNALSWDQKFELDVQYVDTQSFWLDLKILFLTVWAVVKREGISAAGDATMPFFKGND